MIDEGINVKGMKYRIIEGSNWSSSIDNVVNDDDVYKEWWSGGVCRYEKPFGCCCHYGYYLLLLLYTYKPNISSLLLTIIHSIKRKKKVICRIIVSNPIDGKSTLFSNGICRMHYFLLFWSFCLIWLLSLV